jgi:peptidoglycan/LPS O-acetylase OafA/YrhL
LAKERFVALDGLRGVAAITVLFLHGNVQRVMPSAGHLAVDLFFLMSGFVIAIAYDRRLASGLSLVRFFFLRLGRFYPLYFAGYLLGASLLLVSITVQGSILPAHQDRVLALASGIAMLPEPRSSRFLYPLNVVAWSLLFEIIINVAYAATWRFWTKRFTFCIFIVSGAALIAAVLQNGEFGGGFAWGDWHVGLLRATCMFSLGVFLSRWIPESPVNSWPSYCSVIAIAAASLALWFLPSDQLAVSFAAVYLLFPIIVWVCIRSEPPAFFKAVCVWSGGISFALYATHYPLLSILGVLLPRLHLPEVDNIGMAFVASVICLVVASILHFHFDEPLRASLFWKVAPPTRESK